MLPPSWHYVDISDATRGRGEVMVGRDVSRPERLRDSYDIQVVLRGTPQVPQVAAGALPGSSGGRRDLHGVPVPSRVRCTPADRAGDQLPGQAVGRGPLRF